MAQNAVIAQLVEHSIGNGEVSGSIPDNGSKLFLTFGSFVCKISDGSYFLKLKKIFTIMNLNMGRTYSGNRHIGGWENIQTAEETGKKVSVKLKRNADNVDEDEAEPEDRFAETKDFFANDEE